MKKKFKKEMGMEDLFFSLGFDFELPGTNLIDGLKAVNYGWNLNDEKVDMF